MTDGKEQRVKHVVHTSLMLQNLHIESCIESLTFRYKFLVCNATAVKKHNQYDWLLLHSSLVPWPFLGLQDCARYCFHCFELRAIQPVFLGLYMRKDAPNNCKLKHIHLGRHVSHSRLLLLFLHPTAWPPSAPSLNIAPSANTTAPHLQLGLYFLCQQNRPFH